MQVFVYRQRFGSPELIYNNRSGLQHIPRVGDLISTSDWFNMKVTMVKFNLGQDWIEIYCEERV